MRSVDGSGRSAIEGAGPIDCALTYPAFQGLRGARA